MLEPLIEVFEKLVTQFSWRRLGFLLGAFLLASLAAWIFESYTGHFRLARLTREIELLRQLTAIAEHPAIKTTPELQAIYGSIRRELESTVAPPPAALAATPGAKKALAATAPWLSMLGLLAVEALIRKRLQSGAVLGVLVLAVPFVIIAKALPSYNRPWINYWLYPWGTFVAFILIATLAQAAVARGRLEG
jgi:hypothetical protein